MPDPKRNRQKARRQAQLAAAAAARRRARRRRRVGMLLGAAMAAVAVVLLVSALVEDEGGEEVTAGTSTTVAAAQGSAAGKPCVPAEAVPPGAPAVPVKVGPPPTELVKQDLKVGTGADVTPNATVTVNYIGVACSTGKIFDSSYSRNQPATFPLNGVIKGWQDGIPDMKVGGQRLLGIPAAQAYGSVGRPPSIAPDEALWFVVEVLDAKPA